MKKNNTPRLTDKEKEMIKQIGMLNFANLHRKFYNEMCKPCKVQTILLIKRNKKMQYDQLCTDCQITYTGMARGYIKSEQ